MLSGWMILYFHSKLVSHINGATTSGHKLMSHEWTGLNCFFWYTSESLIVAKKKDKTRVHSTPWCVCETWASCVAHGEHVLWYKCDGYYLSPLTHTDLVGGWSRTWDPQQLNHSKPETKLNRMINHQDSPQEETISKVHMTLATLGVSFH